MKRETPHKEMTDDQKTEGALAKVCYAWDDDSSKSSRKAKRMKMRRSEFNTRVEHLRAQRDTEIAREINSLSGEERQLALEILRDLKDAGDPQRSVAYQQLWEIDYKRKPVPIDQFLDDEYYLKNSAESLYGVWRKELREVFAPGSRVTEWHLGGCFLGSTRIRLGDGTTPTLEELTKERRIPFPVVSVNAHGEKVLGIGYDARVTKHTNQLAVVSFNGTRSETCTPDHRWMLDDLSWVAAQDLKPGMRLVSRQIVRGVELKTLDKPVPVYDITVEDYHNFVLASGPCVHNSIGCGKTYVAGIATSYVLYRMSCLHNPQKYYGLSGKSKICFGIYSATKTQVQDVAYDKLRMFLDDSPYFKENFPLDPRTTSRIVFPGQNILIVSGSREVHALGRDLFLFCYSERTLVQTEDGPVPIKELIERPRRVWTSDGNRVFLTDDPVRGVFTGYSDLLRITFKSGQVVECTPRERIRGEHGWLYADEMKPGDRVVACGFERLNDINFVHAKLRDLPSVSSIHRSAPEVHAHRGDDRDIQAAVSACAAVRPEHEPEASRGCRAGVVSGVRHEDAVRDGKASGASWADDGRGGRQVPEPQEDRERSPGAPQRVRTEKHPASAQDALVQEGFAERDEEDARDVPHGRGDVSQKIPESEEGSGASWKVDDRGAADGISDGGSVRLCSERARDPVRVRADCSVERTSSGVDVCPRFSNRTVAGGSSSRGSKNSGVYGEGGETSKTRARGETCRTGEPEENGRVESPVASVLPKDQDCLVCGHARVDGTEICEDKTALVDEVVSIDRVEVAQPVYDLVNVPETHAFFAGTDSGKTFIAAHQCLDESNFLQQVSARNNDPDAKGQAEQLYETTTRRIQSRFMQTGGVVPGMVLLCSSKTGQDSFMERRKKDSKKEIASGSVRVSEFSIWQAKGREKYNAPFFYVEVGDRLYPSRILNAKTREQAQTEARADALVREVPGEYFSSFEKDVEQALRELAGQATYGLAPLIRQRHRIYECITDAWDHPFTREEISISDESPTLIDEFFILERAFRIEASYNRPRVDPTRPRFIHIDIAFTGDSLGIACGHVHGMKEVRVKRPDGLYYANLMPEVYIDFMLRVTPPRTGEIDLSKVRSFIHYLRDSGLPIGMISFDGYQSKDSAQVLRKGGFETQEYSVDRTDEAYMALKQGIFDGRIKFYEHKHFLKELEHLERDLDEKKIDHPQRFPDGTRGSKDVSDCVAAVFYLCTNMPEAYETTGMAAVSSGSSPVFSGSPTMTSGLGKTPAVERARQELRGLRRK